jgi:WD40 repeat protein
MAGILGNFFVTKARKILNKK